MSTPPPDPAVKHESISIQEEKKEEIEILSSSDADDDEPRRSGRKRKSTTMMIQGHIVKTDNNYVLKGHSYSFGAFDPDAQKTVKKPASAKKVQQRKTPIKRPAHHDERMSHNAVVKERMAKDAVERMKFMAAAYPVLEPFLDDKVKAVLQRQPKQEAKQNADSTVLGVQPEIVTTTLRDYQMIGLDWMTKMHKKGMPMVLGDEMGLGKTLQTISLIAHLKEKQLTSGPSLVICPLSVLYSWCHEVQKHAPSLKHFRLHASDPNERESQKAIMTKDILKYDIIVTTYEMVKSPQIQSLIRNTFFNYCVLDEGHVIKNTDTNISEAVRKIHSQNKLILTGTPLQNNLVELFAILNYLYPDFFTKPDNFANAFDISQNRIDAGMLLKANKLLGLFMLRRLKDEVEKLMPKKLETKILCPLSSTQIFWYKGFLMNEIETLIKVSEDANGPDDTGKGKNNILRNLVMQLRKCCLHPYMFDFAEASIEKTSVEELIASSGKLAVLDMVLRSLFKNGSRTVIFSQFTSMLNILEDYCVLRGWKYCRFDGSTPRAQRNHLINQFNAPGSEDFIFLMSTRSGGLGINLQTADTCILYDSDWNPQPDLQAMARVHRIGQKKTVHIYRLVSSGTVEERVLERAEKKLYLDQMVNGGGSSQAIEDDGTGFSTSELLASLKFGSNAIFSSSNDMPTDDDIAKLTDRSRSEATTGGLLTGGVANSAKDYDTEKKLTSVATFEGVDFRKLRDASSQDKDKTKRGATLNKLKQEWKAVQYGEDTVMGKGKRQKTSRIVQMNGLGSGYGAKSVPVLAMNNYGLEQGEPSVWKETKRTVQVPKYKEHRKSFVNQDFCQTCGDGGVLILCPRCPISVHEHCCGLAARNFQSCSHHRCSLCNKTVQGAGGLLYPCQSCPSAFCGDCLPEQDLRFLGNSLPRFDVLGHGATNNYHYIHCSKQCENVAKAEFGFKEAVAKPVLPAAINVSYAFGTDALSVNDIAKRNSAGGEGEVAPSALTASPRTTPRKASAKKRQEGVITID